MIAVRSPIYTLHVQARRTQAIPERCASHTTGIRAGDAVPVLQYKCIQDVLCSLSVPLRTASDGLRRYIR